MAEDPIVEENTMLNLVKLSLRIVTDAFNDELNMLIGDCLSEMEALGVNVSDEDDFQIQSAVVAYCKWKFGDAENKDDFERIYHIKLAQFQMMYSSGYAGVTNG